MIIDTGNRFVAIICINKFLIVFKVKQLATIGFS